MSQKPTISHRGLSPTSMVESWDHLNRRRQIKVAGEFPLTIMVDGKELVTLMTLGAYPEELALGYLRNQFLIETVEAVRSVETDWDKEQVQVSLNPEHTIIDWEAKTSQRIVTSGCGQGTIFSCTIDKIYSNRLADQALKQSELHDLLINIAQYNQVYREAGAVHGCALCQGTEVLMFVEDVGRHNAADTIAGMMWMRDMLGDDKIFYTTGRLTSEMVMKCTQMGIPILLSRSGVTQMGVELAQNLNLMMIARAKNRSFLILNNHKNFIYDFLSPPDKEG